LRFTLTPITRADAQAISRWRYDGPYVVYNGNPASVASLLQPRYLYHSVHDGHGELVGYFCFGEDARVSAGRRTGLYDREDALDVGLGMRPDLTGRGLGEEFVRAGLQFADETYSPPAFRLTVATFNRRAIRVYERAGFERVETFGATRLNGEREWLLMRRARLALQPEEVGGQDA
jgi:[ribosomal protein S18]-alanine N-acetyltransferase